MRRPVHIVDRRGYVISFGARQGDLPASSVCGQYCTLTLARDLVYALWMDVQELPIYSSLAVNIRDRLHTMAIDPRILTLAEISRLWPGQIPLKSQLCL